MHVLSFPILSRFIHSNALHPNRLRGQRFSSGPELAFALPSFPPHFFLLPLQHYASFSNILVPFVTHSHSSHPVIRPEVLFFLFPFHIRFTLPFSAFHGGLLFGFSRIEYFPHAAHTLSSPLSSRFPLSANSYSTPFPIHTHQSPFSPPSSVVAYTQTTHRNHPLPLCISTFTHRFFWSQGPFCRSKQFKFSLASSIQYLSRLHIPPLITSKQPTTQTSIPTLPNPSMNRVGFGFEFGISRLPHHPDRVIRIPEDPPSFRPIRSLPIIGTNVIGCGAFRLDGSGIVPSSPAFLSLNLSSKLECWSGLGSGPFGIGWDGIAPFL